MKWKIICLAVLLAIPAGYAFSEAPKTDSKPQAVETADEKQAKTLFQPKVIWEKDFGPDKKVLDVVLADDPESGFPFKFIVFDGEVCKYNRNGDVVKSFAFRSRSQAEKEWEKHKRESKEPIDDKEGKLEFQMPVPSDDGSCFLLLNITVWWEYVKITKMSYLDENLNPLKETTKFICKPRGVNGVLIASLGSSIFTFYDVLNVFDAKLNRIARYDDVGISPGISMSPDYKLFSVMQRAEVKIFDSSGRECTSYNTSNHFNKKIGRGSTEIILSNRKENFLVFNNSSDEILLIDKHKTKGKIAYNFSRSLAMANDFSKLAVLGDARLSIFSVEPFREIRSFQTNIVANSSRQEMWFTLDSNSIMLLSYSTKKNGDNLLHKFKFVYFPILLQTKPIEIISWETKHTEPIFAIKLPFLVVYDEKVLIVLKTETPKTKETGK